MLHYESIEEIARERYREYLATAAQERRIVGARGPQLTFTRRAARSLGRALLRLGAGLLRYGRAENAATMEVYRPSARSITLN